MAEKHATVRPAMLADLEAITGIYNDAILNSTATFDTEPKTSDDQRTWFDQHSQRLPVLVAEMDGAVVGWASLSLWSDRCAYADTAEASVYVHPNHRRRGVGRGLLGSLIAHGRRASLHTIVGRIAEGNDASLQLAEAMGFRHVGTMREVGFKFGRRLDVHLLQLMLDEPGSAP